MIIDIDDLPQSVRDGFDDEQLLKIMLDGLNARALRVAPCLAEPTGEQLAEAKLILIGAVKRWGEAGSGAYSQEQLSSGPFAMNHSIDTRQKSGFTLWPSEIDQLKALCDNDDGDSGKAFMIDQVQPTNVGDGLDDRPDLWFQYRWPARS